MRNDMWKRNFMFRSSEALPLKESENELFHDTDPAMDSTGLQLEKFLSVWIQGDGQAKNICEETLYMCTGEYMKHRGSEMLRILFVDENNSCRSQMAEGIANSLNQPGFLFSSAGLEARAVDWRTTEFMQEQGVDISRQTSKPVSHILNLEHYHVIIALAKGAQKVFPPPPTKTVGLDWTVADPSSRPGSLADVRDAYEETFQYINTHVRELVQALVGDHE